MGRLIQELARYCEAGTIEAEPDDVFTMFEQTSAYDSVREMVATRGLSIVVGSKGSGKSILARQLFRDLRDKSPRMFLRPADIEYGPRSATPTLAELTRDAHAALVTAVASRLGAEIPDGGETLPLDATLQQAAANKGFREQPKITLALNTLAASQRVNLPADFLRPDPSVLQRLYRAMIEHLERRGQYLYVIIDDPDQVGVGHPAHLQIIWGLLLAARRVSEDSSYFRVLITMRTQVWKRLSWDKESRREQYDQFKHIPEYIGQSREDQKRILRRRLAGLRRKRSIATKPDNQLAPYFAMPVVVTSWTSKREERAWEDVLVTQSRCPRDSLVLVGMLAKSANRHDRDTILQEDIANQIKGHSQGCIDDVKAEYENDCPSIERIIKRFAVAGTTFSAEKLMEFLQAILREEPPTVLRGETLVPDRAGGMKLWAVLFEIGVLSAVERADNMPRGFRHVHFYNLPDLVQESKWDEMCRLDWELQAVFRPAIFGVRTAST